MGDLEGGGGVKGFCSNHLLKPIYFHGEFQEICVNLHSHNPRERVLQYI